MLGNNRKKTVQQAKHMMSPVQEPIQEKEGLTRSDRIQSAKKILSSWGPLAAFCVVVLALRAWVFFYAVVPTGSMRPLIGKGSYIIANRCAYKGNEVERGDIVVFKHTDNSGKTMYMVKRVIGLPGEKVQLKNGSVYINGSRLDESAYVNGKTAPLSSRTEYDVPEECYFVLGDNRANSADARVWDEPYLSEKHICGKVFLSYSISDFYFRWLS